MEQAETQVVELATNLDDASGELVGGAVAALSAAPGVLDVWTTSIGMKKGRPGVMLSLLCRREAVEAIGRRVIELTGTFGVRHRAWDRLVLLRHEESVETDFGTVRVKVGTLDGRVLAVKPEFEDVRRLADSQRVPLPRALAAARGAADRLIGERGEQR